jgi:PucR family transcriptional regulator, purine catabolism regulatory protein
MIGAREVALAVRVSELLEMPHLRLELIAGSGGTSSTALWAQTSDLDTPWEFMSPGEMLMKNGRTLPRTATEQVAFLEKLADVKICGLLIGVDPMTPPLSAKTLKAADRLDLPLIKVPYSVSFATIAKAVAYAAETNESRRLSQTERVYNTIRRAVTGAPQLAPLRQLSRDLACKLAVVDADTGDRALEHTDPAPAALLDLALAEVRERGGAVPGVIHLSLDDTRALMVEVPDEEPTIMIAYDFRDSAPDTLLLQHMATAVAVLLAQQGLRREQQRRIGGEFLSHLMDGRLDNESARSRLSRFGISQRSARMVAIVGGSESGQRQVHVSLSRRGIGHLLLRRSDVLYALLSPSDECLSVLRRRLGDDALIGLSDALRSVDRIPAAGQEAVWAARAASAAPEKVSRYRDATLLSVLRDPSEARVVVDRVLGELIAYDCEHESDMVKTLDTFLRCQRSWQRTATELSIHRQTVVYRIRRIEQITGRRLVESAHIAELWLALRARELTSA